MNNIAYLNKHITELSGLVETTEKYLLNAPDNIATRLSLSSLNRKLGEMQLELKQEKERREIEVIEVRLKGAIASFGSIPLRALSEISRHLSDILQANSYKLWKGKEAGSRIPNELIELLDLRLAGIAPGSTKLYISASTNPNLFGQSLIEDSLSGTLRLLNVDKPAELDEALSEYSAKGIRSLSRLLGSLNKNDLEVDMTWNKSSGKAIKWKGTKNKINNLWMTLQQTKFMEPETMSVIGEIITLSSKGRGKLEIRPDNGKDISCVIPSNLAKSIMSLKLGQQVKCHIEKKTYFNESTGFEKSTLSLISIASIKKIGKENSLLEN
ncbi:MAG: hypothetical protein QM483_10130 [Desulfuromusa sp.]